ncbi:MAG: M28 family peptidase, partial [Pseudomonadota bacterium]
TAGGGSQIFLGSWDHDGALALLADAPVRDAAVSPAAGTGPGIEIADLRRHVEALAGKEFAGRLTGTEGERLATAYVADAFAAIGIEPAGEDGGFFQQFEFTAGVALEEGNTLSLSIDGKAEDLELGNSWTPLAFSRGGQAPSAPVAFAGYGLSVPETGGRAAIDSYGGLDLDGKWVLIWRGLPAGLAAKERVALWRFADMRYKASVAKSKGAAGVIFAPPPDGGGIAGLPKMRYDTMSTSTSLPVVAVTAVIADRMLSILGAGQADMTAQIEAGEAVSSDLIGVSVATNVALKFERKIGRNVLGRLDLDGIDDARPPLYIGAHVDHLGTGETSGSLATSDESGQIHYGADDNASGVAALIEIAQKLATDHAAGKLTGTRDVVFATWSGEELGLLGVNYFTEDMMEEAGTDDLADAVSAYINMDMIGRLRDNLVVSGLGSSEIWAREIERRNAVIGLPIVTSQNTYLPTDATAFYIARVPILSLFTGAHRDYHTPRDTPDLLNYEGLKDIARFAALVARSRVLEPEEPGYLEVARPERQGNRRVGGVFLGTIPDYAQDGVTGVAISGVVKNGPAEKAGLAGQDVIVGIAGQELEDIYDFVRAMNGLKPGEAVDISVMRDGARQTFEIVPAVRN